MLYDIVLYKVPIEDGLTKAMIMEATSKLSNFVFCPIEIKAAHQKCSAMGFITAEAAKELDYDYHGLCSYISSILDSINKKENLPFTCEFQWLQIYIGHGKE